MKQVLVALALVLGAVLAVWKRAGGASPAVHTQPAASAEPESPTGRVVISMLYGPEKEGWVIWAQDQYVHTNPNVQIKLTPMGSVASIDAILSGKQKPTVWSPESALELGDVAGRWKKQTGRALYASDAAHAPTSLLRTAVVLVTWESRAKVLDEYLRKNEGKNPQLWKRLVQANAAQESWKGFDGPAAWGPVKLGYTDPLQTGAGLWTMYLASLDEAEPNGRLTLEKLDDPQLTDLLRSATSSALASASPRDIVKRMEQFGPSQYDAVVTYETLALEAIKTPKERWERLVIYYPPKLVWSDHPAVVLELDGISNEQRKAGQQWIQYLKSKAVQEKAISYGFRPADETIPLSADPDDNPFVAVPKRVRERVKAESASAPPDGEVVAKLVRVLQSASDPL